MVNQSQGLDDVFGALASSTRRAMVLRLSKGSATIGELGEAFDITKGAVTKHVKVLERAKLLRRDVQGRVHRCEMDVRPLDRAQRWVEQVRAFWNVRLDDFEDYLEAIQRSEKRKR